MRRATRRATPGFRTMIPEWIAGRHGLGDAAEAPIKAMSDALRARACRQRRNALTRSWWVFS